MKANRCLALEDMRYFSHVNRTVRMTGASANHSPGFLNGVFPGMPSQLLCGSTPLFLLCLRRRIGLHRKSLRVPRKLQSRALVSKFEPVEPISFFGAPWRWLPLYRCSKRFQAIRRRTGLSQQGDRFLLVSCSLEEELGALFPFGSPDLASPATRQGLPPSVPVLPATPIATQFQATTGSPPLAGERAER